MVPLPRLTTVGGVPLAEIATKEQIDKLALRTREAGTEIVKLFGKGSAFFSPAWSAIIIAESYLKDKRRVLRLRRTLRRRVRRQGPLHRRPLPDRRQGPGEDLRDQAQRRREAPCSRRRSASSRRRSKKPSSDPDPENDRRPGAASPSPADPLVRGPGGKARQRRKPRRPPSLLPGAFDKTRSSG